MFTDVPSEHWAYEAIEQLQSDGIIEGYGDKTYLGNRNITRYEMAQMIARAMTKNLSGEDRIIISHLTSEFEKELNNLGVRVDKLEKLADKVELHGELCFTYTTEKHEKRPFRFSSHKTHGIINDMMYRGNIKIDVNDNWTIKSRIEAHYDTGKDRETQNLSLERAWAEGKYNDLTMKFGKIFYLSDYDGGFMMDTEFSGMQLEYGHKWRGAVNAGRINNWHSTYYPFAIYDDDGDGFYETGIIKESASDLSSIELKYQDSKWNAGIAYFTLQNSGFKTAMKDDEIKLYEAAVGYRFNKYIAVDAEYIKNTQMLSKRNVNNSDRSYNIRAIYKGFEFEKPGTFTIWLANALVDVLLGNFPFLSQT